MKKRNNIIDFAELLKDKNQARFMNQLIANVCIYALIDVTQDINRILHYLKESDLNLYEAAAEMAAQMDEKSLSDFKELLETQAHNLQAIYKAINSLTAHNPDAVIHDNAVSQRADNYLNSGKTRADVYAEDIIARL